MVRDHGLDAADPAVVRLLEARVADPLFTSGAVRRSGDALAFVYKAAAEIGELGDNTAVLRAAIRDDELLHLAVAADAAEAVILGHTRWASVGIISEPNAHPLDHQRVERRGPTRRSCVGALNGDVDNYADLEVAEALDTAAEITTDAKVIPTLVSRGWRPGARADDAFRTTVATLEGSVAIGAAMADAPGRLHLALRGSGQALYVGLAEDAFVVASEPYGLVEETTTYLRLDGETPADPERAARHPRPGGGDRRGAAPASSTGIRRLAYDGTPLPVTEADDLQHARDHHPRHRPRRLPALPVEGDLGGARLVPQDAAGQGRRATDGRLRGAPARPPALPDAVRARLADGIDPARARDRAGHRRGGRGRRVANAIRDLVGDRLFAEACSPPSCRGSGCGPTCPTRS